MYTKALIHQKSCVLGTYVLCILSIQTFGKGELFIKLCWLYPDVV